MSKYTLTKNLEKATLKYKFYILYHMYRFFRFKHSDIEIFVWTKGCLHFVLIRVLGFSAYYEKSSFEQIDQIQTTIWTCFCTISKPLSKLITAKVQLCFGHANLLWFLPATVGMNAAFRVSAGDICLQG